MTQEINNREYRKNVLRELLTDLHAGKPFEEVKARFEQVFKNVSATEIAEAEQALIREGISVEEITRLCDVHAAVFKGSVEEIHRPTKPQETPGHPAHTLKQENRALERLIDERIRPHLTAFLGEGTGNHARPMTEEEAAAALADDLTELNNINIHYSRKEHLFFPYMEQHGITAPPKVMWAVDDEIRDMVKEASRLVGAWLDPSEPNKPSKEAIKKHLDETLTKIVDMISKEEDILLPMVLDVFTDEEWKVIADESKEIGYFLISPPPEWKPARPRTSDGQPEISAQPGAIVLPTGSLHLNELVAILNTMPVDITFVDKDNIVRYYSEGKERVFARTKAAIGRRVVDCHPPTSVHVVEGIIESFRTGRKDHEDFWIKLGDKYVLIRYFAVRDTDGTFLGTLEVTQDIKPIQAITGEKRLVSE
ncbi:MAG TPA: DUF438 domain-containing protein [Firmicutes bacterium]|nr:DUF438 domain-containing protein [Candidatus Fermentithermobacillaceae bacterium]